MPDSDENILRFLVELAQYMTELEQDVLKLEVGAGSAPTETLTADQLNAAIEKRRPERLRTVVSRSRSVIVRSCPHSRLF